MARRTFFSFHYQADVTRANVVKNSWVTRDREDSGFFDSSAFERAQRTDEASLKAFLNNAMDGSSVVCVLVGNQTAARRWVRYEIQRGIWESKGIVGVRVHTIADLRSQAPTVAGPNPLDMIGVYPYQGSLYLAERVNVFSKWENSRDFTSPLRAFPYASINTGNSQVTALSQLFALYDWANGGYANIGTWIESAAQQAGR